jgi:hypothetical protein
MQNYETGMVLESTHCEWTAEPRLSRENRGFLRPDILTLNRCGSNSPQLAA